MESEVSFCPEHAKRLIEYYKHATAWKDGGKFEPPSLVSFSRASGIALEVLLRWSREEAEFESALVICREYLLQYVIDGVLTGRLAPQSAKLFFELERERNQADEKARSFELKISYPAEEVTYGDGR